MTITSDPGSMLAKEAVSLLSNCQINVSKVIMFSNFLTSHHQPKNYDDFKHYLQCLKILQSYNFFLEVRFKFWLS